MLGKKVEKAMNEQLNREMWSAYLYLSMAAQFEGMNLAGLANWMKVQYREEMYHAMKFYNHINERGGRVTLMAIDAVPTKWSSPLKAFEDTLKHERKVTAFINDLMDLAIKEKDHASQIFLQWFVTEQVEEEANAGALLEKLRIIGKSSDGLFMLDQELAQRMWTPPVDAGVESK